MSAGESGKVETTRDAEGNLLASFADFTIRTALQPIFLIGEGRLDLVAYEALARVSDPEAMMNDAFFVQLSHEERARVEQAMRKIHFDNARAHLQGETGLFINFNPTLFDKPAVETSLIKELQELATTARILAGNVICEITEQKAPGRKMLAGIVAAMRQSGFAIAVDDFGADHSDLERVNTLDPDIVKFDATWVQKSLASPQGRQQLAEQVAVFRSDERLVLFEGIERDWQIRAAEEAGAQLIQGFGLARPQTVPAEFESRIAYKNTSKAVAKRTAGTGEAKTIKWNTKPRFPSG